MREYDTSIPKRNPLDIIMKLSKGHETIVSPIDSDLAALKWSASTAAARKTVYAYRPALNEDGTKTTVLLHRIILGRKLGRKLLKTERVAHLNGNPLDNRRDNIELKMKNKS